MTLLFGIVCLEGTDGIGHVGNIWVPCDWPGRQPGMGEERRRVPSEAAGRMGGASEFKIER